MGYLTPAEWNHTMALRDSYAIVAREVRGYLASRDDQISTTELVNALYPPVAGMDDAAMAARKRLFGAVQKMAGGELADCATKGPEKKVMGRIGRAWLWHASRAPSVDEPAALIQLRLAARAMLDALDTLPTDAEGYTHIEGMDPEALATLNSAWSTLESAAAEKPIT